RRDFLGRESKPASSGQGPGQELADSVRSSLMHRIVAAVTIVCTLLVLGAAVAQSDTEIIRKLPPDVFRPYTPAGHPRTFAYFGAAQVLGPIQRLRERAALAVAKRSDCDKVEYSEFSTTRSSLGH